MLSTNNHVADLASPFCHKRTTMEIGPRRYCVILHMILLMCIYVFFKFCVLVFFFF